MRKIISIFAASLAGAIIGIGVMKYTSDSNLINSNITTSSEAVQNARLASFTTPVRIPSVDFTNAAEHSVNGVVHVTTEFTNHSVSYNNPWEYFFRQQPMQPQVQMASGSGVIISADGYIVTNNHVVKNAEKVNITLNNKREYVAEVIGTDPSTDLALLKIDAQNLTYVPYGNSDEAKVGEWVLAIGNPYNLTSTVTAGIISAKGRDINILKNDPTSGVSAVESFIQTDAAVNPGNSGGALVSTNGYLLGINTAIKSNTGSYTGYSFAVPVNIVKKVVDDLLEYGSVQRAYIGVSIQNIDERLVKAKGIEMTDGVYISGVVDDGGAKNAGIKEGDIIIKIGTILVKNVPELQEQISKFSPGEKVVVSVNRNGKEIEIPVTLKNRKGTEDIIKKQNPKLAIALGADFIPITKDEMKQLGITNGIKINKMQVGKLRSSGIKEGFIITKVDKKKVASYDDITAILSNKKGGVLIEGVYPNGMHAYYGFGM